MSKNSKPITFDWTDISYPKQWEVRYKELRDFDKNKNPKLSLPKPLVFDRSSNSFRLPEGFSSPQFAPPLKDQPCLNLVLLPAFPFQVFITMSTKFSMQTALPTKKHLRD